jgi:hypothetical protein
MYAEIQPWWTHAICWESEGNGILGRISPIGHRQGNLMSVSGFVENFYPYINMYNIMADWQQPIGPTQII